MNSTWLYIACKSAIYRSIILFPLQSNDIVLIILNLLVCNCRAEISPRPDLAIGSTDTFFIVFILSCLLRTPSLQIIDTFTRLIKICCERFNFRCLATVPVHGFQSTTNLVRCASTSTGAHWERFLFRIYLTCVILSLQHEL